jgi:hypothetical protein
MAAKKILLVEGKDDGHVLKHLCGKYDGLQLDEVKELGGVVRLLEDFPVRVKAANNEGDIVGLVVDADADLASRWEAVRASLLMLKYENVPATPAAEGTILEPPSGTFLPRVGIWIMPNNRTTGALEDFLRFLVPAESWLLKHVDASISAIPAGERRFSGLDASKAIIHTWLAWQAEPGKPFGTAITARYLDPDVAEAGVLVAWLKRLFLGRTELEEQR